VIEIKAQAWSMDIALAVVIFIVAFFVIYNIVASRAPSDISGLQQEAERISKEIISQNSSLSLVDGEILNETKILNLSGQNYIELKKKIRIENEFCIYFEDEEGNVINITDASGRYALSIGYPEINISGVPCNFSELNP